MALTDKQEMFCREYLIDLNATQAAIRAGYSEKTANRTASENLSKPDIFPTCSTLFLQLLRSLFGVFRNLKVGST